MRLTFYGGAGEVGRSCVLLEDHDKNLMMDAGIKLGEKTEYPLIGDMELKRIHDIAITHAHLDHCGYLPHVHSKNAKPRIWVTKPTRDLMGILLSDYHRIQNDKIARNFAGRDEPANAPRRETQRLFGIKDVNSVMQDARILEPEEQAMGSDFRFTLHPSGHILGSSMIRVPDSGGVIYTGDICMRKTRILDACQQGLSARTLIMESTYGKREDVIPSYKESAMKLVATVNKTLNAGGHVIIPSFAVGRGQEILMILDDYMRSGALAQSRIYIEGMIGKAMRIYRHNAYYANDDIKRRILMSEDDPFKSPSFHTPKNKDREDVLKEPCIIVTTSGMLSGGPVLFYLEKLGTDPRNKLVFVGFQAPGTRGAKILEGERKIQIKDKEIELKLQVEQIKISGHADFNELVQFVKSIKGLKRVFVVHGEETDLPEALGKQSDLTSQFVYCPKRDVQLTMRITNNGIQWTIFSNTTSPRSFLASQQFLRSWQPASERWCPFESSRSHQPLLRLEAPRFLYHLD
jgi:predicted metal-dependent RNase